MSRLAAAVIVAALVLSSSAPAHAQAGARPAAPTASTGQGAANSPPAQEAKPGAPAQETKAPSADDICRTLEAGGACLVLRNNRG